MKRLLGTVKVSEKVLHECSPLTKTSEKRKINQSNFKICDNLLSARNLYHDYINTSTYYSSCYVKKWYKITKNSQLYFD